ncbi:MAG: hypothetical protein A2Y12_17900 [Planctomycetes bacterium GWF2_42_9]|nr:MAG: hypothetical protein A2Y12_17900 [Planctomycetes bacterium GWF2_42_9]
MKKCFFKCLTLSLCVLISTTFSHASNLIKIGFDDGAGQAMIDSSGNANDGRLWGFKYDTISDWQHDHPAPIAGTGFNYSSNYSLSFDKNNFNPNFVEIRGSAASTPSMTVTYAFWIKDDNKPSIGNAQFSYLGGRLDSFYLERYFNGTDFLRYRIGMKPDGFSGEWWAWPIYTDVIVPLDGLWHHIAFTYDSSTKHCIGYIDGIISVDNDLTPAGLASYQLATDGANNNIWFGIAPQNGFRRASFLLDEFVMYDEALTETGVAEIAHKSCIRPGYSAISVSYNFDQSNGEQVRDVSGNRNNGTLYSFAFDGQSDWVALHPNPVSGLGFNYTKNESLSFDKNNTLMNYLGINASATISPWAGVSFEFWIKDDNAKSIGNENFSYLAGGNDKFYIERYFNGTNYLQYRIGLKNAGFVGNFWDYPINVIAIVPVDAKWHHIAFTYDIYTKLCVSYVDGSIYNVTDIGALGLEDVSLAMDGSNNQIWFGIAPQNGLRRTSFMLDEFKMYRVGRTPSQVAYDANNSMYPGYVSVDEFDSYLDNSNLQASWQTSTGSAITLYPDTADMPSGIMQLAYNNSVSGHISPASHVYSVNESWYGQDIAAVDVRFAGKATNLPSQLRLKISDNTNTAYDVLVDSSGNPDLTAIQSENWTVWHIDLQKFTSIDLHAVKSIAIEVGNATTDNASGQMLIDYIRLYPVRCLQNLVGDLNGDCSVNIKDFAIFAQDWLKDAISSANLNGDITVDGKDLQLLTANWLACGLWPKR